MPLDPLTVIFALVAIAVIWKLRSVLGERTGTEKRRDIFSSPASPPRGRDTPSSRSSNVIALPGAAAPPKSDPARWQAFLVPGSLAASGLDAISAADPAFSAEPFVEGAKIAYEAVVTAFASGERKMLQSLLARDVYEGFDSAIRGRETRKEKLTTTIVSLDDAKIESATLDRTLAHVAVRFRSKQISATHGADGALVDGSPDRIIDVNDIWTFERDVTSRDPNWKLAATQSGH